MTWTKWVNERKIVGSRVWTLAAEPKYVEVELKVIESAKTLRYALFLFILCILQKINNVVLMKTEK